MLLVGTVEHAGRQNLQLPSSDTPLSYVWEKVQRKYGRPEL